MRSKISRIMILILIWAYTVFKAIQIDPTHWIMAQALTITLFILMFSWMFVYYANPDLLDSRWYKILAWTGSLLMGFWGTYLLLAIPCDVIFLLNYLFEIILHGKAYNFTSTLVFYHKINIGIVFLSLALSVFGLLEVLRGSRVKKIRVQISNLAPALQNLKIAQISDLHIGPTIRRAYIEEVVRRTNAINPDLVFITGDIADAKAAAIQDDLQPLAGLKARYGVYYVTGNHEYYWDAEGLIASIANMGFVPLINENRVIDVDGSKVLIAGITDPIGGRFVKGHAPDMPKALRTTEQTQLKILLAHRPEVYIEAEKLGVDLLCAGHTHGGQFFPFNVLMPLAHTYYRHLNQYGRLWLHVNPGTGYWGPANRFAVPSEISLLTLT